MKTVLRTSLPTLMFAVGLLSGCGPTPSQPKAPQVTAGQEFEFCWEALQAFFIFQDSLPVNPNVYTTPQALYQSVHERWTKYYEPDSAAIFRTELTTTSGGVGIWIDSVAGGYLIKEVFAKSPGEAAGLRAHDTIVSVNSRSVAGMPYDTFHVTLGGNLGDHRAVVVHRSGATVTISVTLGTYLAPSVFSDTLDSTTVRIILTIFTDSSVVPGGAQTEMHQMLAATSWASNTILDLRGNPGGLLSECFGIASEFLPSATPLIRVRQRELVGTASDGSLMVATVDTTYLAASGGIATTRNFYVLVDSGTASAAEILVSAIKDNRPSVPIIGTHTFGKARGQLLFDPTPLDGIARVTSLTLQSVSGVDYNLIGLTPTVAISAGQDALQVALSLIHGTAAKIAAGGSVHRFDVDGPARSKEPLGIIRGNNPFH